MLKTIKKIIIGSFSILVLSVLCLTTFILNPSLSYANETQIDIVTIHHNEELSDGYEKVILNALDILKTSDLYTNDISIDLCLNDDKIYPNLHPLYGKALGYAVFNKAVLKNGKPNFNENLIETEWPENNFENRKFKLSWLLAHEFSHNLQYAYNAPYIVLNSLGKINWKFEGHAEYISREFKNDGKLKNKIDRFLQEEQIEKIGFPVFKLEDGTQQMFSYYKYALMVQYLFEQKNLNFQQLCDLDQSEENIFNEMIDWAKAN